MKDLIIAIIILLTLIAGFSQTPTEQDSAPPPNTQGTREQGDSEQIEQGKGDLPSIPEPPQSPDYTELALEVINGDWGNGYTRKRLLAAEGHDCEAVQEVVNSILSEGAR